MELTSYQISQKITPEILADLKENWISTHSNGNLTYILRESQHLTKIELVEPCYSNGKCKWSVMIDGKWILQDTWIKKYCTLGEAWGRVKRGRRGRLMDHSYIHSVAELAENDIELAEAGFEFDEGELDWYFSEEYKSQLSEDLLEKLRKIKEKQGT